VCFVTSYLESLELVWRRNGGRISVNGGCGIPFGEGMVSLAKVCAQGRYS
jgi:hypothetical protein